MTHDPFFGDDSFGAWLFEQSNLDEEKNKNKKTQQEDITDNDPEDGGILEANYSDDLESDYEE